MIRLTPMSWLFLRLTRKKDKKYRQEEGTAMLVIRVDKTASNQECSVMILT